MSILLQKKPDSSISLTIDGDLQFDSRDERIYHETLVLPAMALALGRLDRLAKREGQSAPALKVLVVGGGDGLCAREILKEPRVDALTLVDYDARMIKMARQDLAALNEGSLFDPRVRVEVMDAFDFASYQIMDGGKFDLIVCDLTVPRTMDGARLLGVDWFALLQSLLTEEGIACINGLSPCMYSDAYWSIYNSLRASGLYAKPFRIPLPSFREAGYGPDWGFFLAGRAAFTREELFEPLTLAGPSFQLKSLEQWRRLFQFPSAVAGRRAYSRPTAKKSDLLITYLSNPNGQESLLGGGAISATDGDFDFLSLLGDDLKIPAIDLGETVLPGPLAAHLNQVFAGQADAAGERLDDIIKNMGEYLPALDPGHSRTMVEQFLDDPIRFIRGIDLNDLVDRLLARASELPRRFVDELCALKQKLQDFVLDREAILALGSKALAVIALVVILGNLVFTDNAYGKGDHGSFGHVSDSPGSISRPGHSAFDGEFAPAEFASGPGFRPGVYGNRTSVDETGFVYPARRYRYYGNGYSRSYFHTHRQAHSQPPTDIYASYRLTPEADVLPDGTVVISLTDDAYLQLGDQCNTVVDAWSGTPICDLARDPAQSYRVCREVDRQTQGLKQSAIGKSAWNRWMDFLDFMPWYNDDQQELKNLTEMQARLETARNSLGGAPNLVPPIQPAPLESAIEVFASVWLKKDGQSLIIQRPEGLAFYNTKGWYQDEDFSRPIAEEYPKDLARVVLSFFRKEIKEQDEILTRLNKEKVNAEVDVAGLMKDLAEYKACYVDTRGYDTVDYGSTSITLDDAVGRTQKDIELTQQRSKQIVDQINNLPIELGVAMNFIKAYGPLFDGKNNQSSEKNAVKTQAVPAGADAAVKKGEAKP